MTVLPEGRSDPQADRRHLQRQGAHRVEAHAAHLYPPFCDGRCAGLRAARSQGKFWEFHDKLFDNQSKLAAEDLKKYAKDIGLDTTRFEKDLVDLAKKKRVDDDMAERKLWGSPERRRSSSTATC